MLHSRLKDTIANRSFIMSLIRRNFGADLIWRRAKMIFFAADLIWRRANFFLISRGFNLAQPKKFLI